VQTKCLYLAGRSDSRQSRFALSGHDHYRVVPFHVTRDAEVEIQEWEAGDLLETTEEGVRQRRFGDVVACKCPRHAGQYSGNFMGNLQIEPYDVYLVEGMFPLSALKYVANLDRHDLKWPTYVPSIPAALDPDSMDQEEDVFAAIARRNILLHHPYDSFQTCRQLFEYCRARSKCAGN